MMNKWKDYYNQMETDIDSLMNTELNTRSISAIHYMLKCMKDFKWFAGDWEEKEENIPGSLIDDRMRNMQAEYGDYMKYKKMFQESQTEADKLMMLEELGHMIENHKLAVVEMYKCADCIDERQYIKDMLSDLNGNLI